MKNSKKSFVVVTLILRMLFSASSSGKSSDWLISGGGQQTDLATSMVNDASEALNMIAYPNPANDKLNVDFNSDNNKQYAIRMIDIAGHTVINQSAPAGEGTNHVELDLGNLAKGLYILSFTCGDESRQLRIVVE